jgi:peptide chain release factor subunit 1
VLDAITSTQQKLKLYNRVPDNGLVIYCGTILTEEGKEKRVNIDFEPFKPINTSLYLCDNKFHTEVSYGAFVVFSNSILILYIFLGSQ